jgi:hypothetical protein
VTDPVDAKAARQHRRRVEAELHATLARLRSAQGALDATRRRGTGAAEHAARLTAEVGRLARTVDAARGQLAEAAADLAGTLANFEGLDRPRDLIERRTDAFPFLLLPVRLECRFAVVDDRHELQVRLYPDDVAIHTHEETLTNDELEAGRSFWREVWAARQQPDPDEGRRLELGAWRALAGLSGSWRAAWVARRTEPTDLNVTTVDALDFGPVEPADLKDESWTRAPRSYVMPDRFVILTFVGRERTHEVTGALIPDPLIVGPDPSAAEPDLAQVDGDLTVGAAMAWLYDFEAAVEVGMGVRIPIEPAEAAAGFDRVVALGLRLSADHDESAELVAELLDSHHFAPDGLSLLPQGSPTNNTEDGPSIYRSIEPDAEVSFDLELGDPLFTPVDDRSRRTDGQRLAEALGVAVEPLQHLRHVDGRDVDEALVMNAALWPATLGYYANDLLELDPATVADLRAFFEAFVSGRGPLPAIRVGTQPYGILATSDLSRWRWDERRDRAELTFLGRLHELAARVEADWQPLLARVTRAGADGDDFENLLGVLGLHATSVEYHQRHALGPDYRANWGAFSGESSVDRLIRGLIAAAAQAMARDVGLDLTDPPLLFELAFFNRQDPVTDALIQRLADADRERWSETDGLEPRYHLADQPAPVNYIGWLLHAPIADVKAQLFRDADGESLPVPDALLYRYLRRALLLAYHDTTTRLFLAAPQLEAVIPTRETELVDVGARPTASRWRLMEAPLSVVDPHGSSDISIVEHLQLPEGLSRPQAGGLRSVRAALAALEPLPTARLERLFSEHLDLCSYRLDAWQTAVVTRRLEQQRYPGGDAGFGERATGVHLGAFGWLENLRPRSRPTPVDQSEVPPALRDLAGGPIVEQPGNGGYIHGPSLTHAVAAAVLRNAYLTHADSDHPERMAINLSSGRVRTALGLLDGVANGQELGALLGYQFERGLHDRHQFSDVDGLEQYLRAFRDKYPLMADSVTPDPDGEPATAKQGRHVVDGYALVEKTVLADPPLAYPYGVAGLPPAASADGLALQDEVDRLAAALDTVADLALAEGVYQVAQGNHDRAGALMRALADGSTPPEPEIVRTPRSGAIVQHRVTLGLAAGPAASPWPSPPTPRAEAMAGLNAWLGEVIGPPERIRFVVEAVDPPDVEASLAIADLGLQPIDLVLATGDELNESDGAVEGTRDDTTELESRIAFAYRRRRQAGGQPPVGDLTVRFLEPDPSWPADALTMFEVLPLLRQLRRLISSSRPLGAADYRLPSETTTDPAVDPDPAGYDVTELAARVDAAWSDFATAIDAVVAALAAARVAGAGEPELDELRRALVDVAAHGVGAAFPHDAVGSTPESFDVLLAQGDAVVAAASAQRDEARRLQDELAGLTPAQQVEQLRTAARLVLGSAVNLLPTFLSKNPDELEAAAGHMLTEPLGVEEWIQGLMRVRQKVGALERVRGLHEAFGGDGVRLVARQLPFRDTDPWLAVEYGESFQPEGEYLSLVTHDAAPFDPRAPSAGLVIDEWNELIPGTRETTGIAIHYDQPNSEPPQALLLATTPVVTGSWGWDDLVGVVTNTLDRAQRRAIEPDQIGLTAYGHLLPALLTSVSTYPFATVSTAATHATELRFASGGSDDG